MATALLQPALTARSDSGMQRPGRNDAYPDGGEAHLGRPGDDAHDPAMLAAAGSVEIFLPCHYNPGNPPPHEEATPCPTNRRRRPATSPASSPSTSTASVAPASNGCH